MSADKHNLFTEVYLDACEQMEHGFEPCSAFKQCAFDSGIQYGAPMDEFVTWACARMESDIVAERARITDAERKEERRRRARGD